MCFWYTSVVNNKFCCIIPFYNEGENVLSVIAAFLKVKYVDQIVCVDDGSTDGIHKEVTKKFSKINLVRLNKNIGKAGAVFASLEKAKNEKIILFDADLKNVKSKDIEKAIEKFEERGDLDMLILKIRGTNMITDEALRKFIFQGGNRIMFKRDLQKVQSLNPTGYQLEVAINKFMINNNKNYRWIKFSAFNPHKSRKSNFWKGLLADFKMNNQIISYLGIKDYLKQMFLFGRGELK